MSDFVDKILLFILIVTLPIGIYVSAVVQDSQEQQYDQAEQVKLKTLNKTLEDLKTAASREEKPVEPKIEPIAINSVKFASDSGKLKIEGQAPGSNLNVMVQAVVTEKQSETSVPKKIVKSASGSGNIVDPDDDPQVLGEKVDVVAVRTDNSGKFVFVREIDIDDVALVELRFDQADSNATIQYDFIADKRIL